jgi:hypothetical protein
MMSSVFVSIVSPACAQSEIDVWSPDRPDATLANTESWKLFSRSGFISSVQPATRSTDTRRRVQVPAFVSAPFHHGAFARRASLKTIRCQSALGSLNPTSASRKPTLSRHPTAGVLRPRLAVGLLAIEGFAVAAASIRIAALTRRRRRLFSGAGAKLLREVPNPLKSGRQPQSLECGHHSASPRKFIGPPAPVMFNTALRTPLPFHC